VHRQSRTGLQLSRGNLPPVSAEYVLQPQEWLPTLDRLFDVIAGHLHSPTESLRVGVSPLAFGISSCIPISTGPHTFPAGAGGYPCPIRLCSLIPCIQGQEGLRW